MNLALLKAEARKTADRMEARLNTAIEDNRELTEDEQKAQDEDQKLLDQQAKNIKALETLGAHRAAIGDDPTAEPAPAKAPAKAKSPKPSNDGFSNLAEFANAVRLANPAAAGQHNVDDRLAAPTKIHGETGDAVGSFLVPAEFREDIVSVVYDSDDPILRHVDPEPTSKNRVVGLGDETTPWGTSGVQAYWRNEADKMNASKAALTPRETPMEELYAFTNATEELLEDAPRLSTLLTKQAGAAIRWKTAEGYVDGNGVGQPLGWMNSKALVTVAKEGSQSANTIVKQNIAKMFTRVLNPAQAVWFINVDILPQLMELESANGQMLWQPNFAIAPGGMLLGRPIEFTEHNETLGTKGDIQLVNPNGYEAFRKQNGPQFAESIHLYFDYNLRAYRWIFRVGGQPVLSKAVSPAKGSATKSHFVALADRS